MKFSEDVERVFYLDTYHDRDSLLTAINNVDIMGGETNIAGALRYAREVEQAKQTFSRFLLFAYHHHHRLFAQIN